MRPSLPPDVGVIPDNNDAVLRGQVMQQLRGFGADPIGIENDAIIGATALADGLPLISDDRALLNAVAKLGGQIRRFR